MRDVRIPAGMDFGDLQATIERETERLLFLPAPLGEFAQRNGLDPEAVLADEEQSCELIVAWYYAHIEAGGDPDPAVEAIFRRLSAH